MGFSLGGMLSWRTSILGNLARDFSRSRAIALYRKSIQENSVRFIILSNLGQRSTYLSTNAPAISNLSNITN